MKLSLNVGESKQLLARAIKGDGLDVVTDPVEWATSDPKVLTVDPASGLVTTIGPGMAVVSVKWGRFADTLEVSVDAPATGVKIVA